MQNADSVNSKVTLQHGVAPVALGERIAVLDVIRGFALIGIFLMNIEFFNRPVGELGEGMPSNLEGLDWLASYLIAYFVTGKFWTIFSLLFGMGFALMLTRAEAKSQNFLRPYIRRLIALALFGVLHHILIWPGDILFSYAIAATGLLLILFGELHWMMGAALIFAVLAFIPSLDSIGAVSMALVLCTGIAFLLRTTRTISFFGRTIPITSAVLCVMAVIAVIISVVGFVVPAASDLRAATFFAGFLLLLAYLFLRAFQPIEARPWKIGALLYSFLFTMMIFGTGVEYLQTKNSVNASEQAVKSRTEQSQKKPEKKSERKKKDQEIQQEKLADNKLETQILTKGSYPDALKFRAKEFVENWPNIVIFSVLINCMFLIGFWFVRSGVMENTQAHLPMFRKLALFGLPLGIGLGIAGSLLATAPINGSEGDPFDVATGLLYLGNLPACLGYVSLIVLMLNSGGLFAKLELLTPYGRMALTNYLSQSVICSLLFYNYGFGLYGMSRAYQVLVVISIVILQIGFSHWWLRHFRYGPMEWVWRAITYWKMPAFKN